MLDFLYDLPLVVVGLAILAALFLFAILGLRIVRGRVLPRMRIDVDDSEFSGALLQSVMVFYGLAVALIAVNVFQTYSDTSSVVTGEATAIAALYRDVSNYPEPTRTRLQDEVRGYTRQIFDEAWPLQRQGKTPTAGVIFMNHLQDILFAFEPATEGQKLVHGETLRMYNDMIRARRLRVDAVGIALPGVMWFVIVAGAFIGLSASFFFKVEDFRLHAIQVLLLATFMGLVIVMVFALDRPFRGDVGLGSGPYHLIYDQIMTR